MPLEEVRIRAAKLERDVRGRNAREYVAAAIVVVGCAIVALSAASAWLTRVACAAGAVAAVSICVRIAREGWRASPRDEGASAEAWRAEHRAALVRQRDLLRSAWRWYVAPLGVTMALFLVAAKVELETPPRTLAIAAVVCAAFAAVVAYVNRAAAAKLQAEIDRVDRAARD